MRASATALAVELYKWLGDLMMKQIEGLRPAQVCALVHAVFLCFSVFLN